MTDRDNTSSRWANPAWPVAGAVGFVLCATIFLVLYLLGWLTIRTGSQVLGLLVVCLVLGFVPGAILSVMGDLVRNMRAARPVPYLNDGWTQLRGRCERAYERFQNVVASAEVDPVRDRLRKLAARLADQLEQVRSVTDFGRNLDAYADADGPAEPTAVAVWDQVTAATTAFERSATAAEALQLRAGAGRAGLATHTALDALEAGLPQLHRS
ncbi:hypothetical protein [Skermania piniformis]|uniref:Uncharacterized protein n=1 Tax=Skermania pinensis TaxID=39122 RepID=A0ABX8SAV1_9ACTN|nr:hypothetical protein [Skermania piniformis]QXQ14984.1 hypothetical protein KV203_06380 [Skermania piniformis]